VGGGGIRALSLTDELLAISAQDTAGQTWIELRELSEGKVVNRLKQETDVGFLALSPNGKLLVSTDKEGGVRVLDSRSGQTLTNLNLPPTRTESAPMVTFSPDSSRLAIAEGWTGHALLLNLRNWALSNLRTPSGAFVCALAFSPNTNLLAGGFHYYDNPNRAVTLWDARSGELRSQLANSASAVSALFFTSDSRELVAVNRDGSIRSWSMADYAELPCVQGSRQWTGAVALLPDDRILAVADQRSVRLFDLTASNRPPVHVKLATAFSPAGLSELKPKDFKAETLDSRAMCRFTCAFTPDSRSFITSDPDGPLALWSTWPFALKEKLTALGSNHWGVALSPDGHWLATGHAPPGKVTIWHWPACSVVTNLDVPFDFFGMLHFCRSGNSLVSSVFDNRARINTRLWRAGDWTEPPVSRNRLPGAFAVDVSPDERLLAAGYEGAEDNVKLFRFPSGEPYAVFSHPGRVAAVHFSPDGRLLVSAALPGSARLWDVAGQRWLADLEGGIEGLWSAGFSPDGRRIFTGGSEPTDSVRIWDPVSHRELLSLSTGGLWFWLTAFSPDGNTLAAAALSGTTYLWHAPSWEEIEVVESRQKTP